MASRTLRFRFQAGSTCAVVTCTYSNVCANVIPAFVEVVTVLFCHASCHSQRRLFYARFPSQASLYFAKPSPIPPPSLNPVSLETILAVLLFRPLSSKQEPCDVIERVKRWSRRRTLSR
jgi:hypothetical protein